MGLEWKNDDDQKRAFSSYQTGEHRVAHRPRHRGEGKAVPGLCPGLRLVEPHAYGRSTLDNQLLYAFQVGGASESGGIPDWRTFRVDRIRSAEYDSETFEVRPDFDREKLKMRRVVIWAKRR